jgi:hypothetical protein
MRNDLTRDRHRPRPLIRSASVYSGQRPLGRIEVDAHNVFCERLADGCAPYSIWNEAPATFPF